MFMVASSVVSTILILNYHHRNSDTHEMSDWVWKLDYYYYFFLFSTRRTRLITSLYLLSRIGESRLPRLAALHTANVKAASRGWWGYAKVSETFSGDWYVLYTHTLIYFIIRNFFFLNIQRNYCGLSRNTSENIKNCSFFSFINGNIFKGSECDKRERKSNGFLESLNNLSSLAWNTSRICWWTMKRDR